MEMPSELAWDSARDAVTLSTYSERASALEMVDATRSIHQVGTRFAGAAREFFNMGCCHEPSIVVRSLAPYDSDPDARGEDTAAAACVDGGPSSADAAEQSGGEADAVESAAADENRKDDCDETTPAEDATPAAVDGTPVDLVHTAATNLECAIELAAASFPVNRADGQPPSIEALVATVDETAKLIAGACTQLSEFSKRQRLSVGDRSRLVDDATTLQRACVRLIELMPRAVPATDAATAFVLHLVGVLGDVCALNRLIGSGSRSSRASKLEAALPVLLAEAWTLSYQLTNATATPSCECLLEHFNTVIDLLRYYTSSALSRAFEPFCRAMPSLCAAKLVDLLLDDARATVSLLLQSTADTVSHIERPLIVFSGAWKTLCDTLPASLLPSGARMAWTEIFSPAVVHWLAIATQRLSHMVHASLRDEPWQSPLLLPLTSTSNGDPEGGVAVSGAEDGVSAVSPERVCSLNNSRALLDVWCAVQQVVMFVRECTATLVTEPTQADDLRTLLEERLADCIGAIIETHAVVPVVMDVPHCTGLRCNQTLRLRLRRARESTADSASYGTSSVSPTQRRHHFQHQRGAPAMSQTVTQTETFETVRHVRFVDNHTTINRDDPTLTATAFDDDFDDDGDSDASDEFNSGGGASMARQRPLQTFKSAAEYNHRRVRQEQDRLRRSGGAQGYTLPDFDSGDVTVMQLTAATDCASLDVWLLSAAACFRGTADSVLAEAPETLTPVPPFACVRLNDIHTSLGLLPHIAVAVRNATRIKTTVAATEAAEAAEASSRVQGMADYIDPEVACYGRAAVVSAHFKNLKHDASELNELELRYVEETNLPEWLRRGHEWLPDFEELPMGGKRSGVERRTVASRSSAATGGGGGGGGSKSIPRPSSTMSIASDGSAHVSRHWCGDIDLDSCGGCDNPLVHTGKLALERHVLMHARVWLVRALASRINWYARVGMRALLGPLASESTRLDAHHAVSRIVALVEENLECVADHLLPIPFALVAERVLRMYVADLLELVSPHRSVVIGPALVHVAHTSLVRLYLIYRDVFHASLLRSILAPASRHLQLLSFSTSTLAAIHCAIRDQRRPPHPIKSTSTAAATLLHAVRRNTSKASGDTISRRSTLSSVSAVSTSSEYVVAQCFDGYEVDVEARDVGKMLYRRMHAAYCAPPPNSTATSGGGDVPLQPMLLRDHTMLLFFRYRACVRGDEVQAWLMSSRICADPTAVSLLMNRLLVAGVLVNAHDEEQRKFEASMFTFYRFMSDESETGRRVLSDNEVDAWVAVVKAHRHRDRTAAHVSRLLAARENGR